MNWQEAAAALARWHETHDADAARSAFAFIETELRLMVPRRFRDGSSRADVEDALQKTLFRLVKVPLPPGIGNLAAYLRTVLRNECIDGLRARQRRHRREVPTDAQSGWELPTVEPSAADTLEQRREVEQIHAALNQLDVADRVALKLEHGPEWMTDDEMSWLAARGGVSVGEVRRMIESLEGSDDERMHALTRIFDPGDDDATDPAARRLRMERFRKRRARAREKLAIVLRRPS